MIVAALLLAAATPPAVEGWTIGTVKDKPEQIDAMRTIGEGKTIHYIAHADALRSITIALPNCGADKGVDAPASPNEHRKAVYGALFGALDSLVEKCALSKEVGNALIDNFGAAYEAVETMATLRALPEPVAETHLKIGDWAFEDLTENDERKLRMRRSAGQGDAQADLEYRVMAGADRRMNLMVGGCGSNAMLDLPADPATRLAAAQAKLGELIKDVGASCKIDASKQAALANGFDPAFAAIEDWAAQNPVAGN